MPKITKKTQEYCLLRLFLGVVCGVLFLLNLSFAQTPDYNNPHAPIFTDKKVYSWTDKVIITIVAPSWNTGKHVVDSIGGIESHAIKISSKSNSLKPYKLTETSPNSGVFKGEVILTGFPHDVDGDRRKDTNPRTNGNGSTNGFLETKGQDDAVTISFEFADGVVLTHSAAIQWSIGEVMFNKKIYDEESKGLFRIIDRDMNLNPESIDSITVEISSDSDTAGSDIEAIETSKDSGIFEGKVSFTKDRASGNVLYALPGDSILVKYVDRTLPKPHSTADSMDITATANFESAVPDIERIALNELYLASSDGDVVKEVVVGERVQIAAALSNNHDFVQDFSAIIQVKNEQNIVKSISWISGQITSNQKLEVSQSWKPENSGNYTVQIFVWNSLNDAIPLTPSLSDSFQVTETRSQK